MTCTGLASSVAPLCCSQAGEVGTLGVWGVTKMRRALAIPFVLSIFGAIAADTDPCKDPSTSNGMAECTRQNWKAADQVLNKEYQARLQRSDETGKNLLRKAQRAWVSFRDAQCALEEDVERGGHIAPTIYFQCMERTTNARIKQLRAVAE